MSDIKLEMLRDYSIPWVGDRYVYRSDWSEVTEVTDTHVTLMVKNGDKAFMKTVSREHFPTLEKRTIRIGAVFKPMMQRK